MTGLVLFVRMRMSVMLVSVGLLDPGVGCRMVVERDRVCTHLMGCTHCAERAGLAMMAGGSPRVEDLCADVVEAIVEFSRLGRSILGAGFETVADGLVPSPPLTAQVFPN